jgi:hypothetical protein
VPASFVGGLALAQNARLPWVDVNLDYDANAALGSVNANVFDLRAPTAYRQGPDDPDLQGGCTAENPSAGTCTAKYAVDLTNVPAQLHVTTRVQGAAEDRLTPAPGSTPDPTDPTVELGGLGYVHAQLDLGGTATQLLVDARRAASDGAFVGSLRAFDADNVPAPVSGFLNARVDHVKVHLNNKEDAGDPFTTFVFDKAGIVGALTHNDRIGRPFQVVTFFLDVLLGGILELLLDGELITRFDLDMDLPLFAQFDRVDTLRMGMNGPVLSVDEHHPGDGAGDPATLGVRQQSMPGEDDLLVPGAFFHSRDVRFSLDSLVEGFDIRNQVSDEVQDLGLYRQQTCKTHDDDHPCYFLATNDVTLDRVAAPEPRQDGFSSGDILLDFLFNRHNRDDLHDEDGAFVSPGVEFYKQLANATDPVEAGDFVLPDLAPSPVAPQGATFGERSVCCNTTTFIDLGDPNGPPPQPIPQAFGAVCDISSLDGVTSGPRAVGPDGTQYVVVRVRASSVPADADRTLCDATRLVLEAHYPADPGAPQGALGQVRWSIAVPTPAGMQPDGECLVEDVRCEISTTVTPQADGSVRVETTTTRIDGGVDGASIDTTVFGFNGAPGALDSCCPTPSVQDGTATTTLGPVRAWVDASGHPGFHRQEAAKVDGFSPVAVTAGPDGTAALDPCVVAPTFGCQPLPDGHTVQWLFGDGAQTDRLGGAVAGQTHRYPRTPGSDPYVGVLVHLDENQEVVDKAYFTVGA